MENQDDIWENVWLQMEKEAGNVLSQLSWNNTEVSLELELESEFYY